MKEAIRIFGALAIIAGMILVAEWLGQPDGNLAVAIFLLELFLLGNYALWRMLKDAETKADSRERGRADADQPT